MVIKSKTRDPDLLLNLVCSIKLFALMFDLEVSITLSKRLMCEQSKADLKLKVGKVWLFTRMLGLLEKVIKLLVTNYFTLV